MDDLVERARDADRHSVQRMNGSRIFGELADRIEAQEAEIRSLRAQVEQERAGIVAMTRRWAEARWEEFQSFPNPSSPVAAAMLARANILRRMADAIERHEDKEPRE